MLVSLCEGCFVGVSYASAYVQVELADRMNAEGLFSSFKLSGIRNVRLLLEKAVSPFLSRATSI